MKRICISLIVIFVYAVSFAQDFSLSVTNAEAFMTEDYTLKVSLNNNSEISSMQCNVNLPDGLILNGIPQLTNRAASSHSISYNVNREGLLRIVIHSSKNENIIGKDGVLFDLPLATTSDCQVGENIISFEKVIMSSSDGVEYTALPTNCCVRIKELPVKLDPLKITMPLESSAKLNLIYLDEYPYDKTVTWSSSKENVASVSQYGIVSAVGMGSTTISAHVANGIHVECEVNVEEIKANRIELNYRTLELIPGNGEKLIASVYPENTTHKSVTWTSSNESVAKVSTRGYVEAISLGRTTITATCGEIREQCEVYVQDLVLNTSDLKIEKGRTETIRIEKFPLNFGSVTWTSSDENVVTVERNGDVACNVHAVGLGEAYITGSNENYSVTCKVTVTQIFVKYVRFTNWTEMSLVEDESETLNVNILPEDAFDKAITWTSSNADVATVSDTGVVTAVKPGEAIITATAHDGSGASASCPVTVVPKIIDATEVTLNKTSAEMKVGETISLTATVAPSDATDKSVTWSSSDESIATISANGEVTAVKVGTATITATSSNGKSATCKVTVAAKIIEATGITLNKTSAEMKVGETVTLTATVAPSDATDKSVTWSSSDESIATVSSNGEVTAVKAGTATITATSSNGKSATCKVIVAAKIIEATGITLNKTSAEMKVGETVTLTATVAPSDATDKSVTWSSSDESIATVSANGEVTAVKAGTATITAASSNGKSATCKVTVAAKIIEATGITLNKTSAEMKVGETISLSATVAPSEATDKSVTWSSSDESIATVSSNGEVTAVKTGTASITATSSNGKSATCKVTILSAFVFVESLTIDPTVWNGGEEEFTISVTVLPQDATDKAVKFESNDTSVATVDDNGHVKVLKEGTCVITISTLDGSNLSAECVITSVSGVASIFADPNSPVDIFNANGILLKRACTIAELKQLSPGIYIFHSRNFTVKAVIN